MKKQAFSLIEMMVVLLIISIILAATAPIAAKKMARDRANAGNNPWVYTDNNGSVAFNLKGGDFSALIGTTRITGLPNGVRAPRLVLAGDAEHPAFVFARRNGEYAGQINMTENTVTMNGGTGTVGVNSVAIGMGQTHGNGVFNTVAIGQGALVNQGDDIAIGHNAKVNEDTTAGGSAIAIGNTATAQNAHAIAIGINSSATAQNAVAIGNGATTSTANRIELGTNSYTVHIPGNLIVDGSITAGGMTTGWLTSNGDVIGDRLSINGDTVLNRAWGHTAVRTVDRLLILSGEGDGINATGEWNHDNFSSLNSWVNSDKRLKNIGEKYTSGLDVIKKLDVYNFTFKNDKNKTPQVGVMAQDLEKVFPTAVKKDVYGYLRIRWDEMFYAVINAVKELDTRVTELSKNVQSYFDRTAKLEATIEAQQSTIEKLQAQNAEFEKRLAKLEKKNK